jgi:hypothetical protein
MFSSKEIMVKFIFCQLFTPKTTFSGILQNIVEVMQKYKAPMKLWLGDKLVIVVSRPEDVEKILNNSLEKGLMYKFVIPVFGDGLFTRPGW